jgi:hypothetical protein
MIIPISRCGYETSAGAALATARAGDPLGFCDLDDVIHGINDAEPA